MDPGWTKNGNGKGKSKGKSGSLKGLASPEADAGIPGHPSAITPGLRQREEHNRDILERMAAGEALWAYDSKSSWFPPRPTVTKDPKAIGQLYGSAVNHATGNCPKASGSAMARDNSKSENQASGMSNVKKFSRNAGTGKGSSESRTDAD